MNRDCPGAIAWSDGDLDPGLDQMVENEYRKPPNIGIRRGAWIAPFPTVKDSVRRPSHSHTVKGFAGQPEKLLLRLQT